jgi:hypothetical protein
VRVDRAVDIAAFRHIIEARYAIVVQRIVAADIDRDGDVDVVAATDRGFFVWVNDGAGSLRSETAKHRPVIEGRAPTDTWQGRAEHTEDTIQNDDGPSPRLPTAYTHGPPPQVSRRIASSDTTLLTDPRRGTSTPRGPPSHR